MENRVEDREINLIDMFWAICLKWRWMCGVAVLFALLAGGFSYYRSVQAINAAAEQQEEIKLDDIELEDDDKRYIKSYMDYEELYLKQLAYNTESTLMNMDANGFYVGNVSYFVDNHFSIEYPIISKSNNVDAMIQAYKAEFRDESVAVKLAETLGISQENVSYSVELIDASNKYGSTVSLAESADVMTVSVYADNEETCRILAGIVKETIEEKKTIVAQQFGEHDLTLIEDVCKCVADGNLREYQKNNTDKLYNYSKSIAEVKTKLSENALTYIEVYDENNNIDATEKEKNGIEESGNAEPNVSIKMIALGFGGGAALVVFWLALIYLLNGCLRLEDDFEKMYDIKLLGRVKCNGNDKKKILGFIDRMILHMRHANLIMFQIEDAIPMIVASIKIACTKENKKRVTITRNNNSENEKEVVKQVAQSLAKEGIEVEEGNTLLYDCTMVESAADTSLIVLVESAGNVGYMTIHREISICKQQGTKVVGAIVVAD